MIDYDTHIWRRTLLRLTGTVAPRILVRVMVITAWGLGVVFFHLHVHPVEAPSTVHTLVGVALGLLLVFRTNASYERFWEGRKLWAGICSASRNLGRTSSAFLADQPQLVERILLWAANFPYAAMHSLRGTAAFGPSAARLPSDQVAATLGAAHVPAAVALRISDCLSEAWRSGCATDRVAILVDSSVQQLIDQVGGCERIRDTPLPFAYVAHLRLALVLYCLTLPFALVGTFGWATVLDTLLIAYILFGIEEIGVEVENPFGHDYNDLPLEKFCAMVEGELLALVEARGAGGAAAAGAGAATAPAAVTIVAPATDAAIGDTAAIATGGAFEDSSAGAGAAAGAVAEVVVDPRQQGGSAGGLARGNGGGSAGAGAG